MTLELQTRKQQIAFPVVANIRKGAPKGERRPGKDLEQRFRVVFEPGMEAYQKRFLELYGSLTPTTINAMLPFNDLSACYEISNEAYKAGMLVFKAVNGQVLVHRNPENGDYLVRDGAAQGQGVSTTYDPYAFRALTYTSHDGRQVTLPIKTQTRVKLFIPEMEDFVWFLLKSTSYYDSLNIQNNIAAVQMVADAATGGRVAGVRINVFRAQQSILWNSPEGPRRIDKWLLNIKIDPSWVKQMAIRMSEATLGAGTQVQAQIAAPDYAPDPDQDQDQDFDDEDEILDGVVTNIPEQEPTAAAAKLDLKTRPYDPATLRQALAAKAKSIGAYNPSDKQRNLLAALLSEFYQDDEKRHTAQYFLFGKESTKDIDGALIKAALDWLKPQKDAGGAYVVNPQSKTELSHVLAAAYQAEGQADLF